jgi:multicomponent Na+:H+ antiporter subunit C
VSSFAGAYSGYTDAMTALLLVIGLYGMVQKRNLVKKLIGMNIFQTAIFLFFIKDAAKSGATVPVLDPLIGASASAYVNPLPHVLILTAIVVSVATTGVALALLIRIHRRYGSVEEPILLERMRRSS